MKDMEVFGLAAPHICGSRAFFRAMNHPGANNCACPKFDEGVSCVPVDMTEAWFAFIGLPITQPNTGGRNHNKAR